MIHFQLCYKICNTSNMQNVSTTKVVEKINKREKSAKEQES